MFLMEEGWAAEERQSSIKTSEVQKHWGILKAGGGGGVGGRTPQNLEERAE